MKTAFACTALFLILLGAAFLFISAQHKERPVTVWGNSQSYTQDSGYEFNYGAAGHDAIPEVIVFCKVQEGGKRVPNFAYQVTSKTPTSYGVTIDGRPANVPEGGFKFYVNDAEGKPRALNIERSVGEKILNATPQGYIDFWNNLVAPQLK